MRTSWIVAVIVALAACGDEARPVNIPEVPAGASEAACQQLCTRAPGDEGCTAKHAEFCVASCRARTNGLSAACASCVIAAGQPIGSYEQFDETYCEVGGPATLSACAAECDDGGAAPPAPALATLCELQCELYMQDPTPLACSAEGSADCSAGCAAAIAAQGRICAQCLAEQVIPSQVCFDDVCDCSPIFDGDPSFGCETLCDALPPT